MKFYQAVVLQKIPQSCEPQINLCNYGKKKLKKNLSGQRNQKASNSHAELEEALNDMANIDEQSDNEDTEWDAKIRLDSIQAMLG